MKSSDQPDPSQATSKPSPPQAPPKPQPSQSSLQQPLPQQPPPQSYHAATASPPAEPPSPPSDRERREIAFNLRNLAALMDQPAPTPPGVAAAPAMLEVLDWKAVWATLKPIVIQVLQSL